MNTKELFEQRKNLPTWNTSYPIHPNDWKKYQVCHPLSFAQETEASFYIHIPFCKRLCSFCEYTRIVCPDYDSQKHYVQTIDKEIKLFVANHPYLKLRGFDIGGGTPTALSEENLSSLLLTYREAVNQLDTSDDFEPSIEATFDTLTEKKASLIANANIHRISLGIQSTSEIVLQQNHRAAITLEKMSNTIQMLHKKGIDKVNIDLMYGLKAQTFETIREDLQTIKHLQPEQVTLYELRTNMIHEVAHASKEELYAAYTLLYNGLTGMGYYARFGQNTFSKDLMDMGMSSYLRSRMLYGIGYKGFGISAQSMSKEGISYNIGKLSGFISSLLGKESYPEEYTYALPPQELASKYIAIAAYGGSFSLNHLTEILGEKASAIYAKPLEFCLSEEYIKISKDNRVYITPKGFKYYGAVFSLFYSVSR